MRDFIHSAFNIGSLSLPNRLIQGPLAGYSCAPFRELFHRFKAPAYAVSEMISAQDLLHRHGDHSRYLARSEKETILAYQISGQDVGTLCKAAHRLESLGANLIDLNCGCPKAKIRKKGAGSALLDRPEQLSALVKALKNQLTIPLTVKIRIQGDERDLDLATELQKAGADALIVHGRRWQDDYEVSTNYKQIALIKKSLHIPVIANGDIHDQASLAKAIEETACDAFMISRAGCGRPWLFAELLEGPQSEPEFMEKKTLFLTHLQGLAALENEHKAILQARSLFRYYFRELRSEASYSNFCQLNTLNDIKEFLSI